ncbi:C-GCAxxG-C-C family protein [Anaerococcus sp. ENR0831]|uniref:C-GCAxxG-C-C family protein n=1 Tax=Anaerococcus martiniensis TaxID=3115615 RepID=A0ABW9M951_9FIRM
MDKEKLEELSKKEYNCSQIVFAYFAEDLSMDQKLAMKTATAFERGMFKSATCGSLTGAYMALGLKYGSTDLEDKLRLEEMVHNLDKEFEQRNKSKQCKELLGLDINSEEGMKEALEKDLLTSVCGSCIRSSIEITEKIMEEYDADEK